MIDHLGPVRGAIVRSDTVRYGLIRIDTSKIRPNLFSNIEWFLGKHISNWLFDRKCCSGVCSIFSSILKIYPERITFMFLDTFQIKHEQTRIEKKIIFDWTTTHDGISKTYRTLFHIRNIFFCLSDMFSDIGHFFGYFYVDSLPVLYTASYRDFYHTSVI